MKKRRNLVLALLLVASLVLGIGYAALIDDLHVGTTAQYNEDVANQEFDEDIKFVEATSNGYCSAGISMNDASGDTVYIHIGGEDGGMELSTPQQYAEATFTIQNDYESNVKITLDVDTILDQLSDKYVVELDTSDAQNIEAHGGTGTITVKITPRYAFTEGFEAEGFTIRVNAELAE